MKIQESKRISELLLGKGKVVILMHVNPDGDAVGSTLGLYHMLRMHGVEATVIAPDAFPDFLAWLPGATEIRVYDREPEVCESLLTEAAVIVCADFNTADRLDRMQGAFERSRATKVLIDHHIFRGEFCDLTYTDTEISSTAELMFRLFEETGLAAKVNQPVAECLYVGIMTDTGSFSYACNYKHTFRTCSELIATGIDAERIHRQVYDTYSEKRLRLLGYCLSDKLNVDLNLGVAWIALSNEELERFDYRNGDTEGVVNYTLGIQGVIFGALITERKDKIKISLRSKGAFDVNLIARQHFNGGGHRNAAGGDLHCSFDEAVKIFRGIIPMYTEELKQATR